VLGLPASRVFPDHAALARKIAVILASIVDRRHNLPMERSAVDGGAGSTVRGYVGGILMWCGYTSEAIYIVFGTLLAVTVLVSLMSARTGESPCFLPSAPSSS
jgi:hypothetical protein